MYSHEESHIDLIKLCSFASVRFIHAEACGLDTVNKKIMCKDGRPPIVYDVLSIDIGITPKRLQNDMDSFENIAAVKPIDKFDHRWNKIRQRILESAGNATDSPIRVVIVGGGAGGCELCFAVHYRLTNELIKLGKDPSSFSISLVTEGDGILRGHSRWAKFAGHILLLDSIPFV